MWSNFWNIVWLFFWSFAFIAYLFALFAIIGDLFRDHKLNGWWKAVWIIFLIFVPFLTALVYLIARGPGMAERSQKQAQAGAGRDGRLHPHGRRQPARPTRSPRRRLCSTPGPSRRRSSRTSRRARWLTTRLPDSHGPAEPRRRAELHLRNRRPPRVHTNRARAAVV